MWVPDLKVRPGAGAEVVEGVPSLKSERWGVPCTLCGSSKGVVLRCNAGHCTLPFHALCGRNAGFYLAMRPGPGKNQTTYRAYCAQHSESQRRKDASNPSLEPAEVPAPLLPGLQAALLNLACACWPCRHEHPALLLKCSVRRHDPNTRTAIDPQICASMTQKPFLPSCHAHTKGLTGALHNMATAGGGDGRQAGMQMTGDSTGIRGPPQHGHSWWGLQAGRHTSHW